MFRAPVFRAPAFRQSLFYVALFAVVGVFLPFWPKWLASRGLDAGEIGLLVALGPLMKIVVNPLVTGLADRRGERRTLMTVLAVAMVAVFSLYPLADGFWVLFAVTVAFEFVFPPLMPLGESLALRIADEYGRDYGRMRLWGSLSFIAAATLAGHLIDGRDPGLIHGLLLAAMVATAMACRALPDLRTPPATAATPLLALVRDRRFVRFLVATGLIQGGHAAYYGFATLHWLDRGLGADLVGLLWAEGVIAEVLLFAFAARRLARLGPGPMLVLAGSAGLIRWTVIGLTDAVPALVAVQALHAFTFGAAHLAAMQFIVRGVPPGLSASAQGLYSALPLGAGLGAALLIAGPLFAAFGGGAFLAMAVSCGLGAAVAIGLGPERPTADQS